MTLEGQIGELPVSKLLYPLVMTVFFSGCALFCCYDELQYHLNGHIAPATVLQTSVTHSRLVHRNVWYRFSDDGQVRNENNEMPADQAMPKIGQTMNVEFRPHSPGASRPLGATHGFDITLMATCALLSAGAGVVRFFGWV